MATPVLPLFYQRPRPLQTDSDKNLSLSAVASFGFAAKSNVVPMVAAEMPAACRFYPILFAPGDKAQPVILLGLRAGENLFVDAKGNWAIGFYIPAYVRRYPFIFMTSEDGSQYTLCIDEAAPSVVKGRKNPVFDKDGKPTAITDSALAFCRDYQVHHDLTGEFAAALVQADLLTDYRAEVTLPSGEKMNLTGFQCIDEARFNQLPDAEVLRWRSKGWLNLVVCHFISTGNWQTLIDRTA